MYNHQIQTFRYVADCGSFNKAAEKLYITTASVMKQMNALEERIGVQLLERTNRGVFLTAAGKSLYKDARKIIQASHDAIQRAKEAAGISQSLIRIGTSLLNPCKVIMDLWAQVNDIDPHFQIKIVPFEDEHTNILTIISSLGKELDIIVGACDSAQWRSRCQVYPLGNYQICCAIPRSHPLATYPLLQLNDLSGETLIMEQAGDSPILDSIRQLLETQHPQIHILDVPYFYDANVFNICEQSGCFLLTLDAWSEVHPSLVTIPVAWDFVMPYGLLYSKTPSAEVQAFLRAIQNVQKHLSPQQIMP